MTGLSTTLTRIGDGAPPAAVAEAAFDRYRYPDWLRQHSRLVGRIAGLLAAASVQAGAALDIPAVTLAGYLHDIGKSPLLTGDRRPHEELSALILAAEGWPDLVEPARRHPVYRLVDPARAPRTLAERIVALADRRCGLAVVSLEERIAEQDAHDPAFAALRPAQLAAARAIETAVFAALPFAPDALAARLAATE